MRWLILLLVIVNIGYFYWSGSEAGRLNANAANNITIAANGADAKNNTAVSDVSNHQDTQFTIELLPAIDASEAALLAAAKPLAAADVDDIFCWYIGFNHQDLVLQKSATQKDSTQNNSVAKTAEQQKAELEQTIAKIQQRFSAVGIEGQAEDMNVALPKQYLIYLPPAENQAKALAKLKWLLAAGYDAYIFQSGKLKNAIALDTFNLRLGAEKVLQGYIEDGVDAQLRELQEYRSERWLKLSQKENGKIVDRLWRRFETDWPGLIRQKNYCQGIAPAGDIE